MRALHPLTKTEQDMAEQEHQLVLDFLHCKRLPMDDFYDVVIFGYLSAVQQYIRNPPAGVYFKIISLLVDGFALHEAARALKLSKKAVQSCVDEFCCRARAVIV